MKRSLWAFLTMACVAAALPAWAGGDGGKDAAPAPAMPVFKAPSFVFQPGLAVPNLISGPDGSTASAAFNLRFLTVIPTFTEWATVVTGLGWTPLAGAGANAPVFFYGLAVPISIVQQATGGWLSTLIVPLGAYAPGATTYSNVFVVEAAFLLNLGSKMFTGMMSPLAGLSVYLLLDQPLAPGVNDLFAPTLLTGISIPLAPWGP